MVSCVLRPSRLSGTARPPPSLPLAKRMLWAACLGEGGVIGNCPEHPDLHAIIDLGGQLGADAVMENNTADIFGPETPMPPDDVDAKSNACASRLAASMALLCDLPISVSHPLLPAGASKWLDWAASAMGLRMVRTTDKLSISGPASTQSLELEERAGAFWAPGLFMAAPIAGTDTVFTLDDFTAWQPSTSLTLAVLDGLDIRFSLEEEERTLTIAGGQTYPAVQADVENDWRTGSYLLGALLLAGNGGVALPQYSLQPERSFWAGFESAGLVSWNEDGNEIRADGRAADSRPAGRGSAGPGPFHLPEVIDARAYPSLLPLILVLATQSDSPVSIQPLYPLSPRSQIRLSFAMEQLVALGADIGRTEDTVEVKPSKLKGGAVDSGGDSRVAMALGLAGLVANGEVVLEGAEAVSDAHVDFWTELRKLGADVRMAAAAPGITAAAPAEAGKTGIEPAP